MDEALLARIEDASLNASAPPQQRWLDGWLVRYCPGKARRARSVNAVAAGRLPLSEKLKLAAEVYDEAGLVMHVRLTPFSQPRELDAELAARGWLAIEPTRVMVRAALPADKPPPPPSGAVWAELDAGAFADAVAHLRGSTEPERRAHAQRLQLSPVAYRGLALQDVASGTTLACGQFAREGVLVGLYDVFTAESRRGEGLASLLCERLLSVSANEGARAGYLQVSAENHAALRVYRRLGFADGYGYHYRVPPGTV